MQTSRSNPRVRRGLRTWIELDHAAAAHNVRAIRALLGRETKLMAVVKSNAYGHGLMAFSRLLDGLGVDGFCVDSVLEGFRLRREGIRRPILVLGSTLAEHFGEAAAKDIALTVSTREGLQAFFGQKRKPRIHIKIDSGMHRQGFFPADARKIAAHVKSRGGRDKVVGLYTHFASAKDPVYPTFTERQYAVFLHAEEAFRREGFSGFAVHAAATGGTMLGKKFHRDLVRVGIGLYGYYPSRELEVQRPELALRPVLSWHTMVVETKPLPKDAYVGYDLTERLAKKTDAAILPIGYWHGLPRALSGAAYFLIDGRPAKILGRVSMDMTVVDVSGRRTPVGAVATLDMADAIGKSGTTAYEFLTRLNPLIERIVV